MGNPKNPEPQPTAADDGPAPPPYSEVAGDSHSQSTTQPGSTPNASPGTMLAPYRPVPSALDTYYQWKVTTTFLLGNDLNKQLFAIGVHTGMGGKGPGRPGVILHNGPTTNDPMLAAVNDENGNLLSLNSIITLAQSPGNASGEYYTEIMHAATSSGTATFRFSTEVEQKQGIRREDFEWQKSKDEDKASVESPWKGGFKLMRLSRQSGKGASADEGTSQGSSGEVPEIVAIFAWNSNWSVMNPFKIEFRGSGQTGQLGDKFAVMAIITGLRLWWLKHQRRTSKDGIAAREAELAELYPELQTRLNGRQT